MTAQEAYEHFRIMANLQLHQLRVAAVAKIVGEKFNIEIDFPATITAGLLHDMGNILKSDLVVFPDFLKPQGIEYWQSVKDDYLRAYGSDEHQASLAIAQEIGAGGKVIALIEGVGFSKVETIRDNDDFSQKLVEYADLRVGPYGILSLVERLEEARIRYQHRTTKHELPRDRGRFDELCEAAKEIEKQLFSHCEIAPEDVSDESIAPYVETLRVFELSTKN